MPLTQTVSPSAQARDTDTTRRGRSGVVHSPHHGAHIGGDDGEHGTHAVHGHGVHHETHWTWHQYMLYVQWLTIAPP